MMLGCVNIDGGAVELSWTVHDTSGRTVECKDIGLAEVELTCLTVPELGEAVQLEPCRTGSGTERGRNAWTCGRLGGSTAFDIAPGNRQFRISAVCRSGSPAAETRYPDPILRDVVEGEVVQLNALLIEVRDTGLACPGESALIPQSETG